MDRPPSLGVLSAVAVGWQRADRVAESQRGQRMSQEKPGVKRLRLGRGVEQPPLDSGGIERPALALCPLPEPCCSAGAVRCRSEEPLEVETEVTVSRHQVGDPEARGLLAHGELRDRLAVAARSRRTASVGIPPGSSEAVEEILAVSEDF